MKKKERPRIKAGHRREFWFCECSKAIAIGGTPKMAYDNWARRIKERHFK